MQRMCLMAHWESPGPPVRRPFWARRPKPWFLSIFFTFWVGCLPIQNCFPRCSILGVCPSQGGKEVPLELFFLGTWRKHRAAKTGRWNGPLQLGHHPFWRSRFWLGVAFSWCLWYFLGACDPCYPNHLRVETAINPALSHNLYKMWPPTIVIKGVIISHP